MSEEEIINRLSFKLKFIQKNIENENQYDYYWTKLDFENVKGLLDLYNKEKEKNKKLEEDKRVLEILEKEHKKEIDVREQKEIMQSKVIKLMASDMERLGSTDELIEYYFKKARGE